MHDPGTYSQVPAWRSRHAWLALVDQDLVTIEVTELRRGLGRGPVAVRRIAAVAAALADSADTETGRNAMPGVDELMAITGLSETTVQRGLRVLEHRGWIVHVRAGKNRLSRADRISLWSAGSSARQQRAVWACTVPPHARRPTGPVDNPALSTAPGAPAEARSDRGGALPTTQRVEWVSPEPANKDLNDDNASRTGPAGRAPTKTGSKNRADRTFRPHRVDGRTVVLAHDLRERLFWLRETPSWQLRPALDRFAKAGWTARDVTDALTRLNEHRGWTSNAHPRRPYAYLAALLRQLEPTDLVADREHAAALAATAVRWEQLRRTGPECPHRMPAGQLPDPSTGQPPCPLCRKSTSDGSSGRS